MPVTVSHRVYGFAESPAVVLSSSLGTTSEMWEAQAQVLAARFRVVVYEHRGHGSSLVPPGPYTLEELGGDVLALMDSLSIDRARFAGVSLGGMIGMWLGIHAPDRMQSLALLCTYSQVQSPEMWKERAALVRSSGTAAVADSSLARWFTPGFRAAHPDVTARYRTMLAEVPDEGYAGCCQAIAGLDLTADLGRIRAPTLVVAGREDPGATPEVMRRLAAAIPGAVYREVPAGHLANVEQPHAVGRLLVEHFSRVLRCPGPSSPCAEPRRSPHERR